MALRLSDYIRSQGHFVVDSEPSRDVLLDHPLAAMVKGDEFIYDAVRTPMDLPIAKEVIAAVERTREGCEVAHYGKERSAWGGGAGREYSHDHGSDRQPRQQSAFLK